MRRLWFQTIFFLSTNAYLKGFVEGKIFKGKTKLLCVPGLNCYSCPGALGSCPLGSLQAVMGSMKYQLSFYVMGMIMLFGTFFGRFICGYMCPFGLVQDLMFKLKTKKVKLPRALRNVKYFVLVYFVVLFPTVFASDIGIGDPGFCKYICPSGTLLGAVPLLLTNEGLRAAIGVLFSWKMFLLISILTASVFIYRIFCQLLCPLGLIYGWFNKYSFLGYKINLDKCKSCGNCHKVCKLKLDPCKQLDHIECIRCGECKTSCNFDAIERKRL